MKLLGIALAIGVELGQAQTGVARPEFEVASIKSNNSLTDRSSVHFDHGRLTASNASLLGLIRLAYQVENYQLSGAPSWLNSEKFDIVAKAPPNAPPNAPQGWDQLGPMLRTLLLDRFKLAVHRETKLVAGYALVVAKTGSKLHESTVEEESGVEKPLFTGRRGDMTAQRITVAQITETLSRELDSPVLDMTGIQGVFAIHLQWTPEVRRPMNENRADSPGIFTALQEQLGLKLEARKVPVEILVIDRVERAPGEN